MKLGKLLVLGALLLLTASVFAVNSSKAWSFKAFTPIRLGPGEQTCDAGCIYFEDNVHESWQEVPFYYTTTLSDSNGTSAWVMNGQIIWARMRDAPTEYTLEAGESFNGMEHFDVIVLEDLTSVAYIDGDGEWRADSNKDGLITIGNQDFRYIASGTRDGGSGNWVRFYADGNMTFRYENSHGPLIRNHYWVDDNTAANNHVALDGASGAAYNYVIMVDANAGSSQARLWLFLDKQNATTKYGKEWKLTGTDSSEDLEINHDFYLPNVANLPSQYYPTGVFDITNHLVAHFAIDEEPDSEYEIMAYADTVSGNIIDVCDATLSGYEYEVHYEDNGSSWGLRECMGETFGTTDYGSRVSVYNHEMHASIPREEI